MLTKKERQDKVFQLVDEIKRKTAGLPFDRMMNRLEDLLDTFMKNFEKEISDSAGGGNGRGKIYEMPDKRKEPSLNDFFQYVSNKVSEETEKPEEKPKKKPPRIYADTIKDIYFYSLGQLAGVELFDLDEIQESPVDELETDKDIEEVRPEPEKRIAGRMRRIQPINKRLRRAIRLTI